MKIGDLVVQREVWYGNDGIMYGVIVDLRGNGQLAFIRWTDGTTALLDDTWFKIVSNDRDNKKT